MKKFQQKSLRNILSQAAFNPKTDTVMGMIFEIGDAHYFENRAAEFLREAQVKGITQDEYEQKMIRAISLIALAVHTRRNEYTPQKGK